MGKNRNKHKNKEVFASNKDVFKKKTPPTKNTNNSNSSDRKMLLGKSSHISSSSKSTSGGLSELQTRFMQKLEGAQFRTINERLYTTQGSLAYLEFQADPRLFDAYHDGFREQVQSWPKNPIDLIIEWIKRRGKKAIIADMGCGDAVLAKSVENTVHSFDLVSKDPKVIAADMAHVPLSDESVDVVVYCLALMGLNIADFMKEAYRILKPNGVVWIAEVRSRFEGEFKSNSDNNKMNDVDNGNNNRDYKLHHKNTNINKNKNKTNQEKRERSKVNGLSEFSKFIKAAGFKETSRDIKSNKMFFTMTLQKDTAIKRVDNLKFSAKPCIYKRR